MVDYSSEDDLAAALEGVQVVISALNGAGFAAQPTLAKAAKRAGAKLFVPSEFGNDTRALTDGVSGLLNRSKRRADLGFSFFSRWLRSPSSGRLSFRAYSNQLGWTTSSSSLGPSQTPSTRREQARCSLSRRKVADPDSSARSHVGFELASGKANIIGEGNNP